jgi:hypothetical protein
MGLADMSDDAPATEEQKKRGPRKASEIVAETEERMKAEFAAKMAEMQASIDAATAERDAAKAEAEKAQIAQAQAESVQDQLAAVELTAVDPEAAGAVTINFVSDDCTVLGKSWFRGQELTIAPGTPEWDELWDAKRGKSILEYTEDEQVLLWGERKWRHGHWTGLTFDQLLTDPSLSAEERAELQTILDKKTSRTAPPSGSTTPQKRSPVAY